MIKPAWSLIVLLAASLVQAGAGDATVRKCMVPGKPIPVLIIDWVVIGDLTAINTSPGASIQIRAPAAEIGAAATAADSGAAHRAMAALNAADVDQISITCLDLIEDGAVVKRSAISIMTKSGTRSMLTRYLDDLVARQEEYRGTNGKYAGSLAELGFVNSAPPIQANVSAFVNSAPPIQADVSATDAGWSATARVGNGTTQCQVSAGSGLPGTGEPERGVVACFATRA